jgi:nucleotide-binding universal stress UspA family protein
MSMDERPVVVGFDGSDESEAAVREAAALFGGRTLVVVTVFESADTKAHMDREQRARATGAASAGAKLARALGATVEPHPVPERMNVAETIAGVAELRDAAAIVVGSRGLGRIKSTLLGSTSRELLHHTKRPVVVVHAPE